jgi:hypothetical protein
VQSLIDVDFKQYQKEEEKRAKEEAAKKAKEEGEEGKESDGSGEAVEVESNEDPGVETITTTTTTTVVQTVKKIKKPKPEADFSAAANDKPKGSESIIPSGRRAELLNVPDAKYQQESEWAQYTTPSAPVDPTAYVIKRDDEDEVYLGLRVYTHKDTPAVVVGRLKVTQEKKSVDQKDDKASDDDKPQEKQKQALNSLLDEICDCDECRGLQKSHPQD